MFLLMTAPGFVASRVMLAAGSSARAISVVARLRARAPRRRAGVFMEKSVGSIFKGEQVFHHAREVGGLVQAAERVMELPVERIELVVGFLGRRPRPVG